MKLHANAQLPTALYVRIQKLNAKSSVEYINVLNEWSAHLLRVKGYYKKYPAIHKETNEQIEHDLPLCRNGSNEQKGKRRE